MKLLLKMYPTTKLKQTVKVSLQRKKTESVWNDFMSLIGQCIIVKHIIEVCVVKDIKSWQM